MTKVLTIVSDVVALTGDANIFAEGIGNIVEAELVTIDCLLEDVYRAIDSKTHTDPPNIPLPDMQQLNGLCVDYMHLQCILQALENCAKTHKNSFVESLPFLFPADFAVHLPDNSTL